MLFGDKSLYFGVPKAGMSNFFFQPTTVLSSKRDVWSRDCGVMAGEMPLLRR